MRTLLILAALTFGLAVPSDAKAQCASGSCGIVTAVPVASFNTFAVPVVGVQQFSTFGFNTGFGFPAVGVQTFASPVVGFNAFAVGAVGVQRVGIQRVGVARAPRVAVQDTVIRRGVFGGAVVRQRTVIR